MRYHLINPRHTTDRFFNTAINQFLGSDNLEARPAANIVEFDDRFEVQIAAPGLMKSDFKIEVKDKSLLIKAAKEQENQEKNSNFKRREFSYTSFERRFTLPETIDTDQVTASYLQGILSISLPKVEQNEVNAIKKIEIA